MQEMNAVVLQDCRTIMLHDQGDILLTIAANENTESTYSVPAPIGGYGGGSLVLSPTEKYLLFSYYSGQSEEAFMLFEIGAQGLDLVYEAGYVQGEGASYKLFAG